MAEVRNQSESDDASGMSRTSHSGIDDPQDGLDLTSPPIVITDDLTRSILPPIERVRFRIAVGVLIGFAAFIAIPLVVLFIAVFTTDNRGEGGRYSPCGHHPLCHNFRLGGSGRRLLLRSELEHLGISRDI